LSVGDYVVIDCYRAIRPATITLTGTGTAVTTANTITGTGTIFDQELLEGDVITLGGQELQVNQITSPTSLTTIGPVATNVTNGVLTKPGNSEVWNDRFLKRYATALIKYQWGSNLSKFAGIQMPGGVTLDGVRIMTEAKEEMDKIEEDMYNFNSLPSEIFTG